MHILVSCLYAPSEASVMVGIAASEAKTSRAARSAAPAGPTHRPHGRADLWRVARLCSGPNRNVPSPRGSETLATRRGARRDAGRTARSPVAQTPKTRAGPPYVYHLLPGNESSLVRECFERRPWWRPARATSSDEWSGITCGGARTASASTGPLSRSPGSSRPPCATAFPATSRCAPRLGSR